MGICGPSMKLKSHMTDTPVVVDSLIVDDVHNGLVAMKD